MKVDAFHSVRESVHHDNTKCTRGNSIEVKDLRPGRGNKPLCVHCALLDEQRK